MADQKTSHAAQTVLVRRALPADLDALMELETKVFVADRMSRRSLRHFLCAPTAVVLIAEVASVLAGTATILFRPKSAVARLYSIAVAPPMGGRGVASELLAAAEHVARQRECTHIRLEVHATNHRAISRYHKTGYQEFGRRQGYYEDGGDALRLQKSLGGTGRAVTPVQ